MKKLFNTAFWLMVLLGVAAVLLNILIGSLNRKEESEVVIDELLVRVQYSKTEAGEDKIFGYRVPFGIVWRTGSGDATEIVFSEDCLFEGKRVKAGSYSLWSVPSEDTWIIILNSETGQYGTRYDPSRDYMRVRVPSEKLARYTGSLKIDLTEGPEGRAFLAISWENTRVKAEISQR